MNYYTGPGLAVGLCLAAAFIAAICGMWAVTGFMVLVAGFSFVAGR